MDGSNITTLNRLSSVGRRIRMYASGSKPVNARKEDNGIKFIIVERI